MIKGLYTAASGMQSSMRRQEIISNNLANTNTTGFKKETAINKAFPEEMMNKIDTQSKEIGTLGNGTAVDEVDTDHSAGKFKQTGNSMDWAIKGEGFFVVQTPQGERYTRNGNFTVDNQNRVVTQQGYPVRGKNGFLEVQEGGNVAIDDNTLLVNGQEVGGIRIRSFADKSGLAKEGENLFRRTPEAGNQFNATGKVQKGFVEGSNVNPIEEMTKMIQNSRTYQMDQKVIQINDQTLDQAVNQVGRP
ncbi:flagellar basal-body rod protein FlgF [Halanaerobacter jeridensis]|uniref:Flagellar basal-body rod protein FlgG n=1 Tax=Halanaerobacter jeridensis TaxID=706427 RepID=A0A939BSC9_9FIRM|nr:flagellar basal-body rod protein FlgF [Halanaerobacter jeridensis]MBM7557001.1 flagellar basal-body rod protein FlgG [Halanaerobacter jeridensis]